MAFVLAILLAMAGMIPERAMADEPVDRDLADALFQGLAAGLEAAEILRWEYPLCYQTKTFGSPADGCRRFSAAREQMVVAVEAVGRIKAEMPPEAFIRLVTQEERFQRKYQDYLGFSQMAAQMITDIQMVKKRR